MVAAAASLCDNLQELRLAECGIGDEGAMELFNELRVLPNLTLVDLSQNPITEGSIEALIALLTANLKVHVDIKGNNIQDISDEFILIKLDSFE